MMILTIISNMMIAILIIMMMMICLMSIFSPPMISELMETLIYRTSVLNFQPLGAMSKKGKVQETTRYITPTYARRSCREGYAYCNPVYLKQ